MSFAWLKQYMPRGIYGRAALILVLPVVTMLLVVSVVFIQRHFEDVTLQMTDSLAAELNLVLSDMQAEETQVDALARVAKLSEALDIRAEFSLNETPEDQRRWFDFSGLVVARVLKRDLPGFMALQLPNDGVVRVYSQSALGVVQFEFPRRRVSARNPHQLLVNMVFFGGLMTLIAYIYLRNQLRPITRLAKAAEDFGRGRHVDYSPAGALEIRAAGNAFLDMRARIERQIEQRTMLLSGVSHDLRTPLTRLRLGLSFLDEEDREPLERDVDDMQRMLDEFLSFARGASEGETQQVDFCAFVHEIVDDAKRAGSNVKLTYCDVTQMVPIRKMAMRRAIDNLITNSVRYGTSSEVSVRQKKRSVVIRVEDDGPGIPPEKWEEALKPFTRLDPARNQNQGSGVGLGLAITADIARAHGGVLRLGESKRLGGLSADIVIAL
jgi:two-component system osmolarity sensor histidine kinase EnvZ